ncbi:MAG: hypothetical protein WCJ81_01590 [bacterium]
MKETRYVCHSFCAATGAVIAILALDVLKATGAVIATDFFVVFHPNIYPAN